MIKRPLAVDLDGTLIRSDMLHETALNSSQKSLLGILLWPFYLIIGKAFLKKKIAEHANFEVNLLPYRQDFLDFLKERKLQGQKLILCTASDQSVANKISEHLGIFDEVMASNGTKNLAGRNKANELIDRFGEGAFEYAGNSFEDLYVWKHSSSAILVSANLKLVNAASKLTNISMIFQSDDSTTKLKAIFKSLRAHQWLKNLLIFMPVIASHQLNQQDNLVTISLVFFAFSFCASSVYILNDLFDLESDRAHPRKCNRPFASGKLSILFGVFLAPTLLLISVLLSINIGYQFLFWMAIYFVITCAYSLRLKKLVLIDCIVLALLYTLRIVAGASAFGMPLSFWLLAFSVFLFLSLAFVKRYAELEVQIINGVKKINGRGYYTSDAPILQTLGIASGFASTLVLALYLNSDAVLELYKVPQFIWGAILVLLFWISWIWIQAHRGNMHDDPLVFAIKDRISIFSGVLFGLFIWLGAVGL